MHILRYKFRCLKKYTPPAKWGATETCGIIIRVLCQNRCFQTETAVFLTSYFFLFLKYCSVFTSIEPVMSSFEVRKADGSVLFFHAHIDNAAVIGDAVKGGVDLDAAFAELLPDVPGKHHIGTTLFRQFANDRIVFVLFAHSHAP